LIDPVQAKPVSGNAAEIADRAATRSIVVFETFVA
jgi:hypothetical protein